MRASPLLRGIVLKAKPPLIKEVADRPEDFNFFNVITDMRVVSAILIVLYGKDNYGEIYAD